MTTQTEGVTPVTGSKAAGRAHDAWGARSVFLCEVSSATITNGTIPFDHTSLGLGFIPTAVIASYIGSDHAYVCNGYDPTNKKIFVWDSTDGDNGNADTPSGRFVVVLIGE